jgi:hypothetical protein
MKITLEFSSQEEHDEYLESRMRAEVSGSPSWLPISPDPSRPVQPSTRRRGFSEGEMSFVAEHYATKTVPWIARQLSRKHSQIQALVQKMRKAGGLPRKYARRNGDVAEEAA